jgi:hypothetical protein
MCVSGRFIRETDTGVVPVFAWRVWILLGMLPEREPVSGAVEAAWLPQQTIGPALTSILKSLGATRLPASPGVASPRIATPPNGEAVGYLVSLNGTTWAPNQALRAACLRGAHAVIPSHNCSCGVHAYRWQGDDPANGAFESSHLVPGIVALWGRVLEYEDGYRAEMAYPAALILPPNLDGAERESLEKCARLYRVPVVRVPDEDRGDALIPALR